jgi:cyclopropane-fatty-acyl-phospholipid synthase
LPRLANQSSITPRTATRVNHNRRQVQTLRDTLFHRASGRPLVPLVIEDDRGARTHIGEGNPVLEVRVHTPAGRAAILSLGELAIADAYIKGDIDLQGDLVAAMSLRDVLWDNAFWLSLVERIKAAVAGSIYNPTQVAKHYDLDNIQLFATDDRYNTYTPGIYLDDVSTLEDGAELKFATAFQELGLRSGRSLLDVGCGWGGFALYAAARGVNVTGITLSRHQLNFAQSCLIQHGLGARLLYEDFYKFCPSHRFDAISLMGVLEDLSDYGKVMARLRDWLSPDGRVYLDFASSRRRFGVSSFISRHVWPGRFRLVYLPEFLRATDSAGLEIVSMWNDRRNYCTWAEMMHARWMDRKDQVVDAASEEAWRLFRLLVAGVAATMRDESSRATAYRVVLAFRSPNIRKTLRVPESMRRLLLNFDPITL